MDKVLEIRGLSKTYAGGEVALRSVDLDIRRGEIFALLGPNGAGKSTLIGIVCGLVVATEGDVIVDGHHWRRDFRAARAMIGLVPQELLTEAFETVYNTVRFSRALFGKPRNDAFIEQLLRDLTLWDKRNSKINELSGGMKRRVLIAKALSHEPEILFLDEPTAGVDVSLRRDMWAMVRQLRERGVTIILTTHYIEEAEEMAERIGVISEGSLVLVDDKAALMKKLGRKELLISLTEPLNAIPEGLSHWDLDIRREGHALIHCYHVDDGDGRIAALLRDLDRNNVSYRDLETRESSLEEIFVDLVDGKGE